MKLLIVVLTITFMIILSVSMQSRSVVEFDYGSGAVYNGEIDSSYHVDTLTNKTTYSMNDSSMFMEVFR